MRDTLPANARFSLVILTILGWHLQQGDKGRLVFYFPHIVCGSLTEKVFYVKPKLLPYLIRFILIHGKYLHSSFSVVLFHA
jgi:hypothetical protein